MFLLNLKILLILVLRYCIKKGQLTNPSLENSLLTNEKNKVFCTFDIASQVGVIRKKKVPVASGAQSVDTPSRIERCVNSV